MLQASICTVCTLQSDNGLQPRRHWGDPAGWEPQARHLLPLPLPSASGIVLPGDAVRSDLDSYFAEIQNMSKSNRTLMALIYIYINLANQRCRILLAAFV